MEYWENYNNELFNFSEKLIIHNAKNNFNFIETNLYNHIHDILVLSLLLLGNNKEKNILDYGSNVIPWSNICNKIKVKHLKVTIFDPFSIENKNIKLSENFIVNIKNSENLLNLNNYDFLIFGSSSQYINNFSNILDSELILNCNLVLFTHTPLSKDDSFISNQYTGYKGKQIIRSNKALEKKMKDNNFELIFKSILPSELASVDDDKIHRTIYANFLFRKISKSTIPD